MPDFRLVAPFRPTGDQPQAIDKLTDGLARGLRHQTLLGVTGSGKSLVPDEPVLIGRETPEGDISWSLDRIGDVVDRAMSGRAVSRDAHGTEVGSGLTGTGHFVQTVDPDTHEPVVRRVTAFSRHRAPAILWRVTTVDGRHVTVTGDHNFVRSGDDGSLETVRTTDLRPGDALPIPARIVGPETAVHRIDVAEFVDRRWSRVMGPTVLDRDVAMHSRWLLSKGGRAPLATLEPHHVRTLERFGPTSIVGIHGHHRLPASLPLDDAFLELAGLFVAEGHVADRFATIAPGPEGYALTTERLARSGVPFADRGRDELVVHGRVHAELFRGLCGSRAGEKHLPTIWPDLDDRALGRLLAGYFEGDGWVEPASVAAVTKSERLANELAYALLRFGIVGRISVTSKRAVGTNHTATDYYLVAVRGAEDLAAFERHIGFLSERKRSALARVTRRAVGGNADVLPVGTGARIRTARLALRVSQTDLAAIAGMSRPALSLIEAGRRRLRRGSARRLVAALSARVVARGIPRPRELGVVERALACRWTTVASVTPVDRSSASVYDLSVDGAETFLAGSGGLVVHNTYAMSEVIARHNKPTLVLAHNKTLAAQLYAEFREFFPDNAVEYFVSYFDYYQPEAYLPRSDTYIEKDSSRNEEIDRLRHAATHALFERRDVIIVASVSCIYGLGAPVDYGATVLRLKVGGMYRRDSVLRHLVDLQYQRNDAALGRARFRVRGDTLEIGPASEELVVRVEFFGDEVERITELDPLTGELLAERKDLNVYPATHFVTPREKLLLAIAAIEVEMEERLAQMEGEGRALEAARLRQRTTFDLEMMRELGYCTGVENYSRHLSGREAGSRPWTLLDYFPPDWLLIVDESHMTIPQVVALRRGDPSKQSTSPPGWLPPQTKRSPLSPG